MIDKKLKFENKLLQPSEKVDIIASSSFDTVFDEK